MRAKVRKPKILVDADLISQFIGARIAEIRENKKLSQTTLGEYAGVSFQQIQKYEKGINQVPISKLLQICKALDVEPNYILSGTMIFAHDTSLSPG